MVRSEDRSGGRVSEMGQNLLKDELGADQSQTYLTFVRIHLSSFWEMVSKRISLVIVRLLPQTH